MSSSAIAIAFGKINIDAVMDIITEEGRGSNATFRSQDVLTSTTAAHYTDEHNKVRTVWHFAQGGDDHTDIYASERTLIHMVASEEATQALKLILATTGGFLLEDDGREEDWIQIAPAKPHTLSPNAQLALDIAHILNPRAVEIFRPLFNDQEKLRLFGDAIARRLATQPSDDNSSRLP